VGSDTGAVKEVQKQPVLGYRQGGFLGLVTGGAWKLSVLFKNTKYPVVFPALANTTGRALP
jgi:hypothetical protein